MSFDVEAGEFLAIMGASGSGKTTLLNCISCYIPADSGSIRLGKTELARLGEDALAEVRNKQLGFVFQDCNLLDTLTTYENIALSLAIVRAPARTIDQQVREMAELLGISDCLDKYPYQVSGGQKQRCACARAIINNPKLILADEPTGNLDQKNSREIIDMLKLSNRSLKQTILLITHDEKIALEADRIITLEDGRIIGDQVRR